MAPVFTPHSVAGRALRVPAAAVPPAAARRAATQAPPGRTQSAQRVLTWRDVAPARPLVACHATVASAQTTADDGLQKLRSLGTWEDWLSLAQGAKQFSPNEGYAAVRKVSEVRSALNCGSGRQRKLAMHSA